MQARCPKCSELLTLAEAKAHEVIRCGACNVFLSVQPPLEDFDNLPLPSASFLSVNAGKNHSDRSTRTSLAQWTALAAFAVLRLVAILVIAPNENQSAVVEVNQAAVEIVEEPRTDRRREFDLEVERPQDDNQRKIEPLDELSGREETAKNEQDPTANELERLRQDAERRRAVEEESQRNAEAARQIVNDAWERHVQAERAQALQAIAAQQATANAFFAEGVQRFQSGDYWRAVRYFHEAISVNPNDARYYYFGGLAYYRLGYTYAAQREFRTGASIERAVPQSGVNNALERIQGPERLALERYR